MAWHEGSCTTLVSTISGASGGIGGSKLCKPMISIIFVHRLPTFLLPSRYHFWHLHSRNTRTYTHPHTHDTEGECLPGGKHEELASPAAEGAEYEACFQWRDGTCCTANFTRQLSADVITSVFEFRWDTCGNLSQRCQEYFKRVECFYRWGNFICYLWRLNFDSVLH